MESIEKYFYIVIAKDHLSAQLYCTDSYHTNLDVTEEQIMEFLLKNSVIYGINQKAIQQLLSNINNETFPIVIAAGNQAIDGSDGEIKYELNFSTEIKRDTKWDFREVMHIPSAKKGQKLATLIDPGDGQDGMTVDGNTLKAKQGIPANIKAGKNVVYSKENQSFYAATDGQLSRVGNYLHIHPVFEVRESISMKIGNLDFIGSIIIHGDVPNGFTVKAGGDIKIFGMVEAAKIISGGSIFVSEGFAGNNAGLLQAKENIKVGYVNQGVVYAGNDLYVENTILHSNCLARNQIICQRGNIIGGTLSAGRSIEAKDVGNLLGTKTEIVFGLDKSIQDKKDQLMLEKNQLEDSLKKLKLLGEKLEKQQNVQDSSLRISRLRQRNAVDKTEAKLRNIEELLKQLDAQIGSEKEATLLVRNYIHANVNVTFGKYKRLIRNDFHYVSMNLIKNEIVINPLFS